MDLDKIKKVWQEHRIETNIDADKVQKMIDMRGVNAFEGLLRYEKFSCFLILVAFIFVFPLKSIHIYAFIVYLVGLILGGCWQVYKYKKLKEINLSTMNILEVSSRIANYRKCLLREYILVLVWLIAFIFVFNIVIAENMAKRHSDFTEIKFTLALIGIILFLLTAGLSYFLYQKVQVKKIKAIEDALEEIKYFEGNNN